MFGLAERMMGWRVRTTEFGHFGRSSGDMFGHLKRRPVKIGVPRPATKLSRPLVEALSRTPIFTAHLPNQSTQARNIKSSSNWTCIDLCIR
jgi:hypothetical protein